MRETMMDIWSVGVVAALAGYIFYSLYLLRKLDESRRYVGATERARDRWKKRATDAEGAAGSLRYAFECCRKRLERRDKALEKAEQEKAELLARAVQAERERDEVSSARAV